MSAPIYVLLAYLMSQLYLKLNILDFNPTPESIPPPDVNYRQRQPKHLPVHIHPLVSFSSKMDVFYFIAV